MSEFPLIKSLQTEPEITELPIGHKYATYEVTVEGKNITAKIPEKEKDVFESALKENTQMDKYIFNKIMREVRGIRG